MCGLTGILQRGGANAQQLTDNVRTMSAALLHRGPDDGGVWVDGAAGIALGHQRLSILDLSPAGHQPMASRDQRYLIAYNGEIYNHAALRAELGQAAWRGHSDTEVLLEAFVQWGIDATLRCCVGMFALAVWDRQERVLTLARDRLGEKPLYYGGFGATFLFGSELKALRAHPACAAGVDRDALAAYLRYGYIPAPQTIYRGVKKLLPGSVLTLKADGAEEVKPYWSCAEVATGAQQALFAGNETEAANALETLLRDAVGKQSIADVPLGAFLSGGVDSSLIVALMQAQSNQPVRTFTIGFHEWGYDEAPHAAAVARHLHTEHTELYISTVDAQAVIPQLPQMYDEPFADSSQIPTHLVARMARQHVTVSMSGDGGDELFGGYNRHFLGERLWRSIAPLPPLLRSVAAGGLNALPPAAWDVLGGLTGRARLGDKLHKLAGTLRCDSPAAIYRQLISQWHHPAQLVIGGAEPEAAAFAQDGLSLPEQMMLADTLGYLPDDILVKVDRASMSVSLEARAPYLDHRVVEFAWRLPLALKIRNGQGKWLLRQVLYRHVPRALIERPKMGFGVPIDRWLRGALRDWAEHLLDEERLRREGWFHPAPIRRAWVEHLAGKRNWQHQLWVVLMFQAWQEQWIR